MSIVFIVIGVWLFVVLLCRNINRKLAKMGSNTIPAIFWFIPVLNILVAIIGFIEIIVDKSDSKEDNILKKFFNKDIK